MSNLIEFLFSIDGLLIPRNYHYCLYAAFIRLVPNLKENSEWAIGRISNTTVFDDRTSRLQQSTLKIRCTKELIALLTPLFNCEINLAGNVINLKLEKGYELQPNPNLSAWVSIKTDNNRQPDPLRFAVSLGKQMAKCNIDTLPTIGRKELLIIKKEPCAVYPVIFLNLSNAESMTLQSQGLGGRKHIGCGFFE